MPTIKTTSAADFAHAVTSALIQSVPGGVTIPDHARLVHQSLDLLVSDSKRLSKLVAWSHALVPASPKTIAKLANLRDLPRNAATAAESWLLAADVATFCPVVLPGWQSLAKTALENYGQRWRTELKKIVGIRKRRFLHVPFLRILLYEETEKDWVCIEPWKPSDGFRELFKENEGVTLADYVHVVRRPLICWPADPGHRMRHVSMDRLVPEARLEAPPKGTLPDLSVSIDTMTSMFRNASELMLRRAVREIRRPDLDYEVFAEYLPDLDRKLQ